MADAGQPGFGTLMFSGVQGFFKGATIGGLVGAVGGALLGAAVGLLLGGPPAVALALTIGASLGTMSFGAIGAMSGSMTSIITKSREGQVSVDQAANAVKVAFTQGVEIGKGREEPAQETSRWRDKVAKEQASRSDTRQI